MYAIMSLIARMMANIGGAVLSLLIIITCVSIAGRSANGMLNSDFMQNAAPQLSNWLINAGVGPIRGDFELVEAGMAFCIFAFLPLCQISGAHAYVDIFTSMMSRTTGKALHWLSDVLFAAVLIVIAYQLAGGMQSKVASGQTTLLIQYPVWWGYALSLVGAVIAAVVAIYIAWIRSCELITGRDIMSVNLGNGH